MTDSYIYDAFGNLRDHLGKSENRYLYAGEQYDSDAGLYYLRARYYDPQNGRFLTHDPYVGNPHEPVTLHSYLYGNANPVMYADPSGEMSAGIAEAVEIFSLMSVMYSVGVQIANCGLHYVYDSGWDFIWSGQLYIGTAGYKVGVGGIYTTLRRERFNGSVVTGEYIVVMGGAMLSPLLAAFTFGDVEIKTPFRASKSLRGLCSWISVTGAIKGFGYSLTSWTMGQALGLGKVEGWDFGVDILWGLSIQINEPSL